MSKIFLVLLVTMGLTFSAFGQAPAHGLLDLPQLAVAGAVTEPGDTTVPTPTPPPDVSKIEQAQPSTFVQSIKTAWSSKTWGVVVGFILMLIVYTLVKFVWTTFPANYLPYMSIGLGILGNVGWELAIGGQVWWQALLSGITTGLSATGIWEVGGKKLFGRMGVAQTVAATQPPKA